MSDLTLLQKARAGEITPEIASVAEAEGLADELVRKEVAAGRVVICKKPAPF